jgi:hypothetical protein
MFALNGVKLYFLIMATSKTKMKYIAAAVTAAGLLGGIFFSEHIVPVLRTIFYLFEKAWFIAPVPIVIIVIFALLMLIVPAFRKNKVLRIIFIVSLIGVIIWIALCLIVLWLIFGGYPAIHFMV